MNYRDMLSSKTQEQSPLGKIVALLRNDLSNVPGRQIVSDQVANSMISMESMSHAAQSEAGASFDQLRTIQKGIVQAVGLGQLTPAQEQASSLAAIYATSPRAYAGSKGRLGTESLRGQSGEFTTVSISAEGVSSVGMEAYDNKANDNIAAFSYAYNMQAARQDEAGELFFPTIVQTPDMAGLSIATRLFNVQDDAKRNINGSLNTFNRVNILKAVVDATVLRNDQTEIVPVVRGGGGASDTTAFFVPSADVTPYARMVDNVSVTTAPLAVGKSFSLLGISQRDALIANGALDATDSIDTARLAAVYVKIAAGADPVAQPAAVVRVDVSDLATSDFEYTIQGNTRKLNLNFSTKAVKFDSATTNVAGAAVPQFAAIGTSVARIGVSLFGSVVQDLGDAELTAGGVNVAKVTNSAGQVLDLTAGAGATIAAIFAGATVIGYDLKAYFSNTNKRQRGQLLDTQEIRQLYNIPLLPPISVLRPVGESEANDAAMLNGLVTTTRIRCSNSAVTTLLQARQSLKNYVNAADSYTQAPDAFGIGRHVVNAAYEEDAMDVAALIDSLKTADRIEDLRALLVNKIRDMAAKLYVKSSYKAASDAIHDGADVKPTVIIVTDTYIATYLNLIGDTRMLGDLFDVKLAITLDSRMAGKLVFSFGQEAAMNSGVPNPLHFGMMGYRPELTVMMPVTRGGATSMELTVQPSFRHVVNCPIMGYLEISNIEEVVASKVTINTATV
jgi:hypothetical protein